MDQPRSFSARAGREITPIDEGRGEATARRVPGDASAYDSSTHDEDIEGFLPHPLQVQCARAGGEFRHGHPVPASYGELEAALEAKEFVLRAAAPPIQGSNVQYLRETNRTIKTFLRALVARAPKGLNTEPRWGGTGRGRGRSSAGKRS